MSLSNEEKSIIYDNLLRESDQLLRINSRIKSEFVGNIPPDKQAIINENEARIAFLVKRLESLFN